MNFLRIAQHTFKDAYAERVLVVGIFSSLLLMMITFIAAEFGYGAISRIVLDIGLGVGSLCSHVLAIFLGTTIIRNELEKKTLYMVLSRPISRTMFLNAKIMGIMTIMALNLLLLFTTLIILYLSYGGTLSSLLFGCFLFIYMETLIILCLSALFSLITNRVIGTLAVLTMWLMGHACEPLKELTFVQNNAALMKLVSLYAQFMPNLSKLNISVFALENVQLPFSYMISSFFYSVFWLFVIVLAANVLFRRKEFE